MLIYDIDGVTLPKNQFILIVNIANQCGFSYQLTQLQQLSNKHPKLHIIAFPSNDFKQLSLTGSHLNTWCKVNHQVDFTIYPPIHVNGPDTHPVFQYLKNNARGIIGQQAIVWNFTKFLIYPQQQHIRRLSPFFPVPWLSVYLK